MWDASLPSLGGLGGVAGREATDGDRGLDGVGDGVGASLGDQPDGSRVGIGRVDGSVDGGVAGGGDVGDNPSLKKQSLLPLCRPLILPLEPSLSLLSRYLSLYSNLFAIHNLFPPSLFCSLKHYFPSSLFARES